VRSRLPPAERKFLEEVQPFIWPFHWVYSVPPPKDATAALWALRQLPPVDRPQALVIGPETEEEIGHILKRIAGQRAWDEKDVEAFKRHVAEHKRPHIQKSLPRFLNWWARPEEFGELYLSALQSYYQVFFADEEKRLLPYLQAGLAHAQDLAQRLSLADLLVELSQGVHFEATLKVSELILVPVFWSTPLVIYPRLSPEKMLFMFGVRPAEVSLVPGEVIPDALLRALKALADPTRLRILRYLAQEAMTPAQLARRLRLRAPTVTHHLSALRLAGLVHLILEDGEERRYAARLEAIQALFSHLQGFLESPHAARKE
jgi:DNA-binding transcriptional ArsR family regulator